MSVRSLLVPARPPEPTLVTDPSERRALATEVFLVFALTLGLSGVRSLLSLLDSLLRPEPLADQTVAINVPRAAANLIDLAYQLVSAAQLGVWGGLGLYLLWRSGIGPRAIGLARGRVGSDLAGGAGLAALIGLPGLAFYLITRAIGINLTVVPAALNDVWWRAPVLIILAFGNAWAEEVLVVGYFITRLRQLGWAENTSLVSAAVLRGSYHLYQGFGGFLGNLLMGLVYGRFWQRTNRLWPLVIGHTLIDVTAFVGYTLLKPHLSWLP
ncbi:CPBP family intramembrane glutamic endopeptidase [Cryptosporangium phraense]|uniref:CPBP family intramembrane metalloprotease n=1 Tax=Cryptosporangium phraense TaxID=2593070 RepID=A0A545AF92_9ACTN|nr:type II CAAX endopeptidase family protein [Cryptosporangium phraense]TQS40002.1 CPBP family intramembrane metalloprotease [Cryptosporangium phraense]